MSLSEQLSRRRGWKVALWALVAAGAVVRIVRFAADRSLWGDEGAIALNIIQRSARELFEPLDFLQGAPTGFLLTEKAATYVLGESELALRTFPLVCGIAALVILAVISQRMLRPEAALLAVALAAFSDPLVYYSSEVKQYETDVLAAVLLLYGAVAVDWARVRVPLGVALAAAGAVVVWFSHAALLVLPSLLAVLLISAWLRRDRLALRPLVLLAAVWGASGLTAFAVNRTNTQAVANAALESTGSSGQGFEQPIRNAWDAYAEIVGVADTVTALAAFAAIAGLVTLLRRNATHAMLLLAPGVAAFAAAIAGRYPFSGRFILFLAPALILLAAEGAVAIAAGLSKRLAPAGIALVVLLLLYPLAVSSERTLDPPGHEEVKAVLRTVEREWEQGDSLYVWYQSQYPFRYYAECDDCGVLGAEGPASVIWPPAEDLSGDSALLTHEPNLFVSERSHDLRRYVPSFLPLDGRRRVWLLFSSTWDDAFVREVLDCMGRKELEARATRAVAYLYDLAATPSETDCAR